MRGPFFTSLVMHLGLIAAAVVGLPHLFEADKMLVPPMVVELVTVEEITKAPEPKRPSEDKRIVKERETAPKDEEPERKAPPPAPEVKQPPQKPEPPKPATKPKQQKLAALPPPEPVPEPRKREPLPPAEPEPVPKPVPERLEPQQAVPRETREPVKVPAPVVEPKQAEVEKKDEFRDVPKPRVRPKRITPPTPKRKRFDPTKIAALLDKNQGKRASDGRNKRKPRARSRSSSAVVRAPKMTRSEIDVMRRQIEDHWSFPAGGRDADNLIVTIKIYLNRDGSLAGLPEIVDRPLSAGDYYRAAAESALRAVRAAAPFSDLPVAKYEHWRKIKLRFNPKELRDG